MMLMQSGFDQINIDGNINMTLNLLCHQLQNIGRCHHGKSFLWDSFQHANYHMSIQPVYLTKEKKKRNSDSLLVALEFFWACYARINPP